MTWPGIRAAAPGGPALGLLVLAEQQHHPRGDHRGPGGDEARRDRRRPDHGGGPGRARGAGAVHGRPLARACSSTPSPRPSRLGLEVNMNNDAGWNGSGGPWIKPEQSMQEVVWTETEVAGPKHFDAVLPRPQATAGFYRDIAVLAVSGAGPRSHRRLRIEGGLPATRPAEAGRAAATPLRRRHRARQDHRPHLADGSGRAARLGRSRGQMDDPPPGPHQHRGGKRTCAGERSRAGVRQAEPRGHRGEFRRHDGEAHADVGPAVGKALVATHIDSWENGSQNWTRRMREEFQTPAGLRHDSLLCP